MAKHLIQHAKEKVLTVSGVYRQRRSGNSKPSPHRPGQSGSPARRTKPVDIARAIDYAKRHYFDVLLVDTAGRLAIDEALMAEIKECTVTRWKRCFVVDANAGSGSTPPALSRTRYR
jgi:signal recognition particle subunit SRP54